MVGYNTAMNYWRSIHMLPTKYFIHYTVYLTNGTQIHGNIRLLGSARTAKLQILSHLTHIDDKSITEIVYYIKENNENE